MYNFIQQLVELYLRYTFLLAGLEGDGIHEMIDKSIRMCDFEQHRTLYSNIALSGGNTMYPGIADRIQREMVYLQLDPGKTKVTAIPERRYGAWIGGSILASLPAFQGMCISKEEYTECGLSIIHRKCF